MRAFSDWTGHVKLWLQLNGAWLFDRHSQPCLFFQGDSIYDSRGRHVAWWTGTEVRDHDGRLLYADLDAVYLGGIRPPWHLKPIPPTIGSSIPICPTPGLRPFRRPKFRLEWAEADSFLARLVAVR